MTLIFESQFEVPATQWVGKKIMVKSKNLLVVNKTPSPEKLETRALPTAGYGIPEGGIMGNYNITT